MIIGFLLGYGLGNEISREHYDYQLNLIQLNLKDKLCIAESNKELYGECLNDSLCLVKYNRSVILLDDKLIRPLISL